MYAYRPHVHLLIVPLFTASFGSFIDHVLSRNPRAERELRRLHITIATQNNTSADQRGLHRPNVLDSYKKCDEQEPGEKNTKNHSD